LKIVQFYQQTNQNFKIVQFYQQTNQNLKIELLIFF
jgi:hypothetical protein